MTQETALKILKTGANLFLTGEPGSGKTHTVNAFVKYLRSCGIEPAITASTGIAATHIHGQTIHSWSGIGILKILTDYDIDRISNTEYISRRIQKNKVLIIDEISMIDATTIDMVDRICREVRQNSEPFGGMQIVLVGDFFQLPPVSMGGMNTKFAFESKFWAEARPLVCYLSEQHRQKDKDFLKVLSAIRKNSFNQAHLDFLMKRLVKQASVKEENVTRLFSHNVDVDNINTDYLSKIEGQTFTFTMSSKGKDSMVAALKKGCLSPEKLDLKIGAVVMCTKNNKDKGYVNGTLGKVIKFEMGTRYPIIETKDDNQITVESSDWVIEEDGKIKASISQIPLRLAWAITIHKSQGLSLDSAVVDLSQVFEYGQGYVALSRLSSIEGLHLLGMNDKALQVHPNILKVDFNFRQLSDNAEILFSDIPKEKMSEMQNNFVVACGGVIGGNIKIGRKEVSDTIQTTKGLIMEGNSVEEIAKIRGLTKSTIINHIEKLAEQKEITIDDLENFIDKKVLNKVDDIKKTFQILDTTKISPIFEHYEGLYSHDQIRLARALINLEGK